MDNLLKAHTSRMIPKRQQIALNERMIPKSLSST
jgi:hypothetical protein